MKKDRFVAFFDAIMAIIMTIVVLEFVIPEGAKWSDLSTLGYQILAYATAFFWLGGLWINIHNLWHGVDIVDRGVLWTNIVMLFFASMIPFFVVYAGRNLDHAVPQLLYGADVIMITLCNELSVELLARHHECVKAQIPSFRISLAVDLSIKIVGVILALTVFPLAILLSVILSTLFLIVWRSLQGRKCRASAQEKEE